nr:BspA family leucine-rich repeat surface protein [uncultured Allomuricauda sp.]
MNFRNLPLLLLLCVVTILSCDKNEPDSVYVNGAPLVQDLTVTVLENISSSDLIGTVKATDPDGEKLMYSIKTDESGLFIINGNGEIRLKNGEILDYESASEHQIIVYVEDKIVGRTSNVTVKVENVIESIFEEPESLITTWRIDADGDSITIGTNANYEYDYTVDWGDGTVEELSIQNPTHQYEIAGTYNVAVQGQFPAIVMGDSDVKSREALISLNQWGNIEWRTMERAFMGCVNMTFNAQDKPDISMVISLSNMFANAESFNAEITNWDVGHIQNMANMFAGAIIFNRDLSGWDVSSVSDMSGMFEGATSFNQNLGTWDIGEVNVMTNMFDYCGISTENISDTLIGWYYYVNENNGPSSINLGANNIFACGIETYLAALSLEEDYNWTIDDAIITETCN